MQCEDLLNLFFGALTDDDVRRTIEFYKDPKDVYEAVDYVVYYHETGRWPKANDEKCRHYYRQAEVDDLDKMTHPGMRVVWLPELGKSQRRGRIGRTRNRSWET